MSEQVKEEGTFKIKRKPKQLVKNDIIKVDLSKPKTEETDAIQVGETKKVVVEEQTGDSPKVDEQVQEPKQDVEKFEPIQEVTEAEVKKVTQEVKEAVRDEKVVGKPLPDKLTTTEFLIVKELAKRPGVIKERAHLMDIAYKENTEI